MLTKCVWYTYKMTKTELANKLNALMLDDLNPSFIKKPNARDMQPIHDWIVYKLYMLKTLQARIRRCEARIEAKTLQYKQLVAHNAGNIEE